LSRTDMTSFALAVQQPWRLGPRKRLNEKRVEELKG